MIEWTQILKHELAIAAQGWYYENMANGCVYHNFAHVCSMYQYLDSVKQPYSKALDWAVLFHDVVYDEKPDKELRSAELWYNLTKDDLEFQDIRDEVFDLIMATKDHSSASNVEPLKSAIIRADLSGLTDPLQVFYNFERIMREATIIYNIDHVTFAENSEKFMHGLYRNIMTLKVLDIEHEEFYDKVLDGIVATIALGRIVRGLI
jgi:predicted metal-dependent HD superfamily phosphohydrolase